MRFFSILFGLTLLLSSCFEHIEEIRLKPDGSGSFTYILNFSQSKSEISSALKMDSLFGLNLPSLDEIKKRVADVKAQLIGSAGISNVTVKEDYENFIIELRGDFTSVEKMNTAAKSISIAMGASEAKIQRGFSYSGSDTAFNRTVNAVWKPEMAQKLKQIMGQRINNASYTLVVKSEKPVTSLSSVKGRLSPSKKAVMVKLTGTELVEHPEYLNVSIRY